MYDDRRTSWLTNCGCTVRHAEEFLDQFAEQALKGEPDGVIRRPGDDSLVAHASPAASSLRDAAARLVAESRTAQGLPPRIENPAVLRRVAALTTTRGGLA